MLKDLRSVEELPVVLDWTIGNKSCSNVVENNACQGNNTCSDFENGLGYRSKCNDGYEGNPYRGCHGIDECKGFNECEQNCINTEGSYTCSSRKGYHGNGRTNGEGCIANRTFVIQNFRLLLLSTNVQ
ncbi:hypothetical protein M0R45_035218 [Rubus argutus]|uniref:EGF-like calcium-binding domain-containing protein n=1 Tax=Rubus argutus TaxID=59490 RepID=A0AAW1VWW2_RUBAR